MVKRELVERQVIDYDALHNRHEGRLGISRLSNEAGERMSKTELITRVRLLETLRREAHQKVKDHHKELLANSS